MASTKLYLNRALELGTGGHSLSHELESYRSYSWQIEIPKFAGLLGEAFDGQERLTLAAKQVGAVGFQVEDIEVHRVNEKFFYPGKPTPDEIVVVFDNLVKGDIAKQLFAWMRTVYDPVYGIHYAGVGGGDAITGSTSEVPNFKRPVTIWQLDQHRNPQNHVILYGCYPKGWKLGEFNYASGDFHTIEMTLRYDFAVQYTDSDSLIPSELNPIAGI